MSRGGCSRLEAS
eukprot:gene25901-biopygen17869